MPRKSVTKTHKIVQAMMSAKGAPHLVEISECLVHEFGGTQAFVKEMVAQYRACTTPALKGPWMRAFVKIVEASTEMGGAGLDMGELTEEDLERELVHRLKGKGELANVE